MNKFLLVGANSRLAKHFIAKYGKDTIPIHHQQIDDLDKYNFDYILNCSALTDIEYCETHPKETLDVNYEFSKKLKKYCDKKNKQSLAGKAGKKLILISSNYAVDPINVYGKSKQKMEELADNNCLVIRTSFFDNSHFIIKNLYANNPVSAYDNAFLSPVSVTRLVEEIYKSKDQTGLLNIFSNKCISYLDFAKLIKKYLNSSSIISVSKLTSPIRPLNGCCQSDVEIDLEEDIKLFLLESKFS